MGKIIIMEEKADKMVDKLERMKECVEEIIDVFTESMEGHRYSEDEDDWDDDYEVKRHRESRSDYPRGMRRGMRGTGGYGSRISRY